MITIKEVKLLAIALIFGIAYWFIMTGMREWFVTNFPNVSTVIVGLVVIILLLIIFKYRGIFSLR